MMIRCLTLLAVTFAAAHPAMTQGARQPGPLKTFKDWVIGCDNLRACSALGLAPEDGSGAYVRIDRGGAGADEPTVAFTVIADDPPEAAATKAATRAATRAATLALTVDGKPLPGVAPLTATMAGPFVTAVLSPAEGRSLIAALKPAKLLTLEMHDGAKPAVTFDISLAGSTAALLFMDDFQGRVGGVSALARGGSAPAGAVPPLPAMPSVKALKMTELAQAPPLPNGIRRDTDGNCDAADTIATELSSGKTLWAVCAVAGAYNTTYRMWIAAGGAVASASFPLPDNDDPAEFTNPALSDDEYLLNSFAKGRGIGDCGEISDWAWDGTRFRLVNLARLDTCRGVLPDDWPTLFQARIEKAG